MTKEGRIPPPPDHRFGRGILRQKLMKHIKMELARHSSGRIISIDEALRGKACDCACISCGTPVVARHGHKNEHSFAHVSEEGDTSDLCRYSFLTSLTLLILQEIVHLERLPLTKEDPAIVHRWSIKENDGHGQVDVIAHTDGGHVYIAVPPPGREDAWRAATDLPDGALALVLAPDMVAATCPVNTGLTPEVLYGFIRDHVSPFQTAAARHEGAPSCTPAPSPVSPPNNTHQQPPAGAGQHPPGDVAESLHLPSCKLCHVRPIVYFDTVCRQCVAQHVPAAFPNITELAHAVQKGWQPPDPDSALHSPFSSNLVRSQAAPPPRRPRPVHTCKHCRARQGIYVDGIWTCKMCGKDTPVRNR